MVKLQLAWTRPKSSARQVTEKTSEFSAIYDYFSRKGCPTFLMTGA
jgi:hypothetical protein